MINGRGKCLFLCMFTFLLVTCFIVMYFEDSLVPPNISLVSLFRNNVSFSKMSEPRSNTYRTNRTQNFEPSSRRIQHTTTIPMRPVLTSTSIVSSNQSKLEICKLPEKVTYNFTENVTLSEVLNKTALEQVQPGGRFEPQTCQPRDTVAIIIPYRNRFQHREILLSHLHNFLQRQMIKYDIYFIEPVLPIIFNRGLLCNIGFKEALSRYNYSCIIFHDVDQLPINSDNHYVCDVNARHLSTESSKNKYKLPYFAYIGGVVAIKRDFFLQLNGFSNAFFGWGGEDDDLLMRIQILNKRQGIPRPAKGVGRYIALPHDRDELNPENPIKFKLYKTSKTRFPKEGLNTLNYTVLSTEVKPLYTTIRVFYNESQIMQEFLAKWDVKPT